MSNWDYIKDFYRQNFGFSEWLVELYANLEILQLCASGASNDSIGTFSDLDEDDIVEILMTTFNFPGWKEDLPVNPYKLYLEIEEANGAEFSERLFIKELMSTNLYKYFKYPELLDYAKIYNMCKSLKEIEERIADEWI